MAQFPQTVYYGRDLTSPLVFRFQTAGLPSDLTGIIFKSTISDSVTEKVYANFVGINVTGPDVTLDRIQWIKKPVPGVQLIWDLEGDNRVFIREAIKWATKATPV